MNYDNIQRGSYETSKGEIYFRSLWEANYALYLDWLKDQGEIDDWEYEPKPRYDFIAADGHVLSLGYLPDFMVKNNDGSFYLVEIKGYKQGMMKLKRMKKYHPHIKIELVEKKDYEILKKKVGKMLNWYP
jgi:hypothetical protein